MIWKDAKYDFIVLCIAGLHFWYRLGLLSKFVGTNFISFHRVLHIICYKICREY